MRTTSEEKTLKIMQFKMDAKLSALSHASRIQDCVIASSQGAKGKEINVVTEADKMYKWLIKDIK